MTRSLSEAEVRSMLEDLSSATAVDEGRVTPRSPVHVLYGGAHLYKAESPQKLGKIAQSAMSEWGSDASTFGRIVGVDDPVVAERVAARVREKLASNAIEAMCIDFEDGYGPRPDAEEDADAVRTARELARATTLDGMTDTAVGIRIKSFGQAATRAVRTLDLFVTTLAHETKGRIPRGFTVTLPKVTSTAEMTTLARLLTRLERACGLSEATPERKPERKIGIEWMVESPKALLDDDGRVPLRALAAAGEGRCVAAHLGAYDLTASLFVTASEQRLDHPFCDLARSLMQWALADTNVGVVDGATTLLPTPRHRAQPGTSLTIAQSDENRADVHRAWELHARHVRRALGVGIYRGWDLHPAQLPARYGALYGFFLSERDAMAARLRGFVERATQATRSGQVFDDAATGQGLLNFFLRGVACGALDASDVRSTGLSLPEIEARSFAKIVAARATTTP